jgi:hypothetical protein
MIELKKPEMHADTGRPIVGIAKDKIMRESEIIEVQFTLTRKINGSRVFPNPFYISRRNTVGYPEKVIKGRRLVMIPLDAFKEGVRR